MPPEAEPLRIETVGGSQPVPLVEPPDAEGPLVAVLPALGIRADYYRPFADALAARGLTVLLVDHPGHGHSPARAGRRASWGYRELLEVHTPAVRAAAKARFPDAPFVWIGHSLGAHLALLDAGRAPAEVSAAALVAGGTPYYRSWRGARRAFMRLAFPVCTLSAGLLGHYPGHRLGFGGREARGLIRDWARVGRTGRFVFEGVDGEGLLDQWSGPTLAIQLEDDPYAPRAAAEHLVHKTRARADWQTWSPPPGADHNRWPKTPEEPAERIAAWLTERGLGH